jgi:hypothetical protein
MPWVKFLKDHKPYKKDQVVDLPSFKAAFALKNAGVLVRVDPPKSSAKALVNKLTGRGAKKVK